MKLFGGISKDLFKIRNKLLIYKKWPNPITMGMIFREKLSKFFWSASAGDQRSNLRFVKNINSQKVTEPYQNGHDFS